MDAREARRLKLTRDAMKMMRFKDFRDIFSPEDGSEANILVAMPDDTIRMVSDRIVEMGGSAHLIVANSADELVPITILRVDVVQSRGRPPESPARHEWLVKENTELGMIVATTKLSNHVTVYVCPNEAKFELVDDGDDPALV